MGGAPDHRFKVAEVLDRYGVAELGDELVRRWSGDGVERQSLRDLARFTNEQLLASAMATAGSEPLDGEAANVYRLLVDDDVSEGVRTQARRRLKRDGIDVEQLEQDFVSYQAIRTYLIEGRGVTHDAPAGEPSDRAAEHVRRLMDRTVTVARERVDRLRNAGAIEAGDVQVLLDLRIFCPECDRQYDIVDFLEGGGCDCQAGQ